MIAVEWGDAASWRSGRSICLDFRPPELWRARREAASTILIFWVRANGLALASPVPSRTEKETTLSAMWKPSQTGSTIPNPTPEPTHAGHRPTCLKPLPACKPGQAEQATIGKGLFIKGEITGSESLIYRRQSGGRDQSARQPRDHRPQRAGGGQHYCARSGGAGQSARQRLGHRPRGHSCGRLAERRCGGGAHQH